MKHIVGLLAIALLTGCSFTKGTRTTRNGDILTVQNQRFFWSSQGINFTVRDTNGFSASLSIEKSNPDAQALEATARGAAQGAASSLK